MNMEIRCKDRVVTDKNEIRQIVEKTKILHLGLFDGEYPYIVPLHYGTEYRDTDDTFVFYMHGAKEGHKLELIRKNPNCCIELENDIELVSGGKIACQYGSCYSSFIGRGRVSIVENEEEKVYALKQLMRHQTGMKFPIPPAMLSSVAVMKAEIPHYTAKARRKRKVNFAMIFKVFSSLLRKAWLKNNMR